MRKAVAYYRVSTQRQGKSGLGLEAQQASVHLYIKAHGIDLTDEFIEIETGKKVNRPVLQRALHYCAEQKTLLIIAKLDRLGRNVAFISALMENKVEFVAVDNPHASRLVLHMLAAFAEHERELISTRTKEALQAAKKRGVELGKYGKRVLAAKNKKDADVFAENLRPLITALLSKGVTTTRALTEELNKRGVQTARAKGLWQETSMKHVLKRLQIRTKDYKTRSKVPTYPEFQQEKLSTIVLDPPCVKA